MSWSTASSVDEDAADEMLEVVSKEVLEEVLEVVLEIVLAQPRLGEGRRPENWRPKIEENGMD